MGNCTITIHVTGGHHSLRPDDIDAMAKDFVAALKAAGHSVTHAAVTNGSTEELHHAPAGKMHHAPHERKPVGPGVPYRNDD